MPELIVGFHWDNRPALQPALIDAMYVQVKPPTTRSQFRHTLWVLDYVFEPAGMFRAGVAPCAWRPRQARTAHLYPPGTPYWEDARRAKRLHAAAIVFNAGEAAGLEHFLTTPARFAEFEDPAGLLGQILREAARIGHDAGEPGFWRAYACFGQILACLHHSQPGAGESWHLLEPTAGTPLLSLSDAVDRYLRNHLADPTTLKHLARHLHISVSTLSHQYRRQTGVTPLTRLAQLRIAQARQLLLLGQSLKTIAPALGFCDAFHLSKTFKRIAGQSPRDFLAATQTRDLTLEP